MPVLASLAVSTAAVGPWVKAVGQAGKMATYTRTGTAVAFIISELQGGRAEALFIAMAALVSTAGEQFRDECARGSSKWDKRFSLLTNKRRRQSAHCRRPMSKNGGR